MMLLWLDMQSNKYVKTDTKIPLTPRRLLKLKGSKARGSVKKENVQIKSQSVFFTRDHFDSPRQVRWTEKRSRRRSPGAPSNLPDEFFRPQSRYQCHLNKLNKWIRGCRPTSIALRDRFVTTLKPFFCRQGSCLETLDRSRYGYLLSASLLMAV